METGDLSWMDLEPGDMLCDPDVTDHNDAVYIWLVTKVTSRWVTVFRTELNRFEEISRDRTLLKECQWPEIWRRR